MSFAIKNHYLSFYRSGIKPFDTLANLHQIYEDYQGNSEEWLNSDQRENFLKGQAMLKAAIDTIESEIMGGYNTMNTNANTNINDTTMQKVTIEIEVPVYNNVFEETRAYSDVVRNETTIVKKKIEVESNNMLEQIKAYLSSLLTPLHNSNPARFFKGYNGVSTSCIPVKNPLTKQDYSVYISIEYDSHYKAIIVRFHKNAGYDYYFNVYIEQDGKVSIHSNDNFSYNDISKYFLVAWDSIKKLLNECLDRAIEKTKTDDINQLNKASLELELYKQFSI